MADMKGKAEEIMPGSEFCRHTFTVMLVLLCAVALASKASAQESPHGKTRFECKHCHTPESWKMRNDASFAHESTGFTLTGQHADLRCVNCHEGLKFKKKSSDCLSCHSNIHKSELGTDCLRCHTTHSWRIADMVQKHQMTRFPLLGRHAAADCQLCHANAGRRQFTATPTDCYGCHREDFNRTASPNHSSAGFSTDCTQCHQGSAMQWGAGFQHDRRQFPLTGAHRSIACIECHKNQVFKSISIQCITCHQNDYSSTQNPNHPSAQFTTTCQTCHTTTVWSPSTFTHAMTAFQLVGAHQAVACNECHVNNVFKGLPHAGCWDCHATSFNGTINPNHVAGQFNHDCLQCHTQSAWKPASFNHATTKFALTGAHATVQCTQCHVNGNYALAYENCYQCHSVDYARPSTPNHVAQLFPTDCVKCHSTSVWTPNTMNHDAAYFRIYSGKHRGKWTQCSQCHTALGNLASFSCTTACHRTEHNQGQDCYGCHKNI